MTVSHEQVWEESPAVDDLAVARRVLEIEGAALARLGESLGESFTAAVEVLAGAGGRVVVTGMGKSGHVGRKVAATLASTGTPALFVHPGEASHGDLGMIASDDAVLVLSNSGETPELADIIDYTRRFKIPLVAIVGRAPSTLADTADVALVLPDCAEACPMGMAPTTSTTMTLALGDALAIALLERADFAASDFRELHPGGRLGRRLITVADIMHEGERMPLVEAGVVMSEALLVMTTKSFGCVGVVDPDGRLAGVITDGDLRRHMAADLLSKPVAEVMTTAPKVIRSNALAAEALWVMNERAITSLFVCAADGKPLGILHVHDCLRAGVA